jgi:5-methyltetrahydropteroyltriglutamate--homocysteine methyltransferase
LGRDRANQLPRGDALKREINIFRSVVGVDTEAFITSTAPASLEPYCRNEYYKTQEEFVFAIAKAMRTEYQAIVAAGFIPQVEDAWLVALWDQRAYRVRTTPMTERNVATLRFSALGHEPT